MKPLTYFLDTQAIDALCDRYGYRLERMSDTAKLGIINALTSAAQSVDLFGLSEPLDLLFCNSFADCPLLADESMQCREIPEYLAQIDKELDSYQEAISLAIGIAQTLTGVAYATV